jgi:hypothetical protein
MIVGQQYVHGSPFVGRIDNSHYKTANWQFALHEIVADRNLEDQLRS